MRGGTPRGGVPPRAPPSHATRRRAMALRTCAALDCFFGSAWSQRAPQRVGCRRLRIGSVHMKSLPSGHASGQPPRGWGPPQHERVKNPYATNNEPLALRSRLLSGGVSKGAAGVSVQNPGTQLGPGKLTRSALELKKTVSRPQPIVAPLPLRRQRPRKALSSAISVLNDGRACTRSMYAASFGQRFGSVR